MESTAKLEQAVLDLPPVERERVALTAWESLAATPEFAADRLLDPDGVVLAAARDAEIASGSVTPISHAEFLKRTGGGA